jgi:hypothetical protein
LRCVFVVLKAWRYCFPTFYIFAFLTWKLDMETICLIWSRKYRQFDVVLCYNYFIKFWFEKNNQVLKFLKFLKICVFLKNCLNKLHNFFRIPRTSRGLNVYKILHKSYWQILRKLRISKKSRPQRLFDIIQKNGQYDFV